MTKPYRICSRCVMDTSDPDISFNKNGVCNHCLHYSQVARSFKNLSMSDLENVASKLKRVNKDKPFDCILGVGGGVDCSYTAYLAYRLGLRVLLVHLDNGWNTVEAEHNIAAVKNETGFPLLRYKAAFEEFNDVVLSFMRASVIDIEVATDHAATALLFNTACETSIKQLLTGCNFRTEAIMPQAWGYRKIDLKNLKAIHKRFGDIELSTYPTISITRLAYYQTVARINLIPVLNYVEYNREESKKILESFCGWRDYGLKHYESVWTRFYQRYILPRKFGVDKRRAHLSTLVCSGQISRQEALEKLEQPLYAKGEMQKEKAVVLKGLGLTEREFEEIMQLPVRSHESYGTDKWLYLMLRRMRDIYRVASPILHVPSGLTVFLGAHLRKVKRAVINRAGR